MKNTYTMKRIVFNSAFLMSMLILASTSLFSQARVQVIHNSADRAAEVVDVWLDDVLLIDDFMFRTATPFIDAPAGVDFVISIAGSGSTSPTPAVAQFDFFLEDGMTYIIVANGIVSPEGYDPLQPFDLFVYAMGREMAMDPKNTDVLVFHGATDAPTVDIHEVRVPAGKLIDDLDYSAFSSYLELLPQDYSLQVRDMYGSVTVAQYAAPLAELGLEGQAITVLASGFLAPGNNSNGPGFGLWAATATGGNLIPLPQEDISTARLQVIHNSADLAAKRVDIYVNDQLFLDDFAFRTATPFVDVPAATDLSIDVLPFTSTSADNPLATFTLNLMGGGIYQAIASGIVSPEGYAPATPFNIDVYSMAREYAYGMERTDVMVYHGSTDAPVVDIFEVGQGAGQLVDDLGYSEFDGYLELPVADYSLQIRDMSGTTPLLQYLAPISALGLDGFAMTVLASGFLNPAANSDGPAFGLFVALPAGGDLIPLPEAGISTARAQIIHNSADPDAAMVDIWVNGQLFLDNFAFRTATPFVDVPANVELEIAVSPYNVPQPVASFNVTFESAQKYVVIANGEIGSESNNPRGFNLYVYGQAREMAAGEQTSDALVFHGSNDAPEVDIVEVGTGLGLIIDDLSYGSFEGYYELPVDDYSLQVRDASGSVVVAQYSLPLETYEFGGMSATVVASGYLTPATGAMAAFGLYAALPTGGALIPLPQESISTARVQVIHNSADLAAEVVDVWLNDQLLIDNFRFRTATPFIDAPANQDITIAVQPANSSSAADPLASFTMNLEGGETYIVVANGIVFPNGYEPYQPFNLYVYEGAREWAMGGSNTDVLVFHGSTDAPAVDVIEVGAGAGQIIDDMAYSQFAGYLELPTANYSLQITDATGAVAVATYQAPLAGFGLYGQAITVVASGFLNTMANNDGPEFGLWVALASGGELIELPSLITGVDETAISETAFSTYPNPATQNITVAYTLTREGSVSIELFDILGNRVRTDIPGVQNASSHSRVLDVSGLPSGMYILRIQAGSDMLTKKVKVVR